MYIRLLTLLSVSVLVSFAAAITSTSAICTGGCSGDLQASATAGDTSVSASAHTGPMVPGPALSADAHATLGDDYILTLHGGQGIGVFTPCLNISATGSQSLSVGSTAVAQFGFKEIDNSGGQGNTTCDIAPFYQIPFDTPTMFHLSLLASAFADTRSPNQGNGASASASFGGIKVNPGITFTIQEVQAVPEPSMIGLMFCGFIGLLALRRGRQ